MRGERGLVGVLKPPGGGSSPHTRGTHDVCLIDTPPSRFIPAYAGNARRRRCPSRPVSVHPRIRGERAYQYPCQAPRSGSSPHTRGTRTGFVRTGGQARFIPAYAGNASLRDRTRYTLKVHPRIRGERREPCGGNRTRFGSSPHTRGTQHGQPEHPLHPRFIPAYAGNASGSSTVIVHFPVHPRIRGERGLSMSGDSLVIGSSPHTRGTP